MANWNNTQVTCNDLVKLKEILATEPFKFPHVAHKYSDKPFEVDAEGFIYIQSR